METLYPKTELPRTFKNTRHLKQLTTWLTVNIKLDFSELPTLSLFGISNLLISYTNQLMDKHAEKYRQ